MYDFHSEGSFPTPHSHRISMPEFLQELYAKINECVDAVNDCIELVDTTNNVIENWNKLKAECDMVMERYANTMAGYDHSITEYTSVLSSLEGRVSALSTSVNTFDTLVQQYEQEVNEVAEDVRVELAELADSIVNVGTTNGWNWRKYKSGKFEATKWLYIDPQGKTSYEGNDVYTLHYDVAFPFPLKERFFWVQPTTKNTYACVTGGDGYITIRLQADHDLMDYHYVDVCCKLEGILDEET